MNSIYIEEEFVDATRQVIYGSSGVYESCHSKPGDLYRDLVKEHGRCIGKVHIDTTSGTKTIGWVFAKRMKYDDSKKTYRRETWVTLYKDKPKRVLVCDYQEI